MDGAGIAARVRFGYAKAGEKLGLPHTLYRPAAATMPALDAQCRVRRVSFISAATSDATFDRRGANPYSAVARYALLDTRAPIGATPAMAVQPGDYVTGPTGTYFVASLNPLEIPLVIECGRTVSVTRPLQHAQVDEGVYGGRTVGTDAAVLTGFPCSLVLDGRAMAGRADLPGDTSLKGGVVLLPPLAGLVIRSSDHVTDDLGRRWTVGGAECSALGWRLFCTLSEP